MNRLPNLLLSKALYYHPRLSYFDKGKIHYFVSRNNLPNVVLAGLIFGSAWKFTTNLMDEYKPRDKSLKPNCCTFPYCNKLQN